MRLHPFFKSGFLQLGAEAARPDMGHRPCTLQVTAFVQGLLAQMQGRFNKMSENIITKIDDMGGRSVSNCQSAWFHPLST